MKRLYLLGLLLFVFVSISSQELRDTLHLYYRTSSLRIDTLYMRNGESLSSFYERNFVRFNHPSFTLKKVTVVGSASPEGRLADNETLAMQRAQALADYLKKRLPLDEQLLEVTSIGVDWTTLTELVAEAKEMPFRQDALAVLQKGYLHHERLLRLKQVRGGVPYAWIRRNLFPLLRYSRALVYYDVKEVPQPPVVEVEEEEKEVVVPVVKEDTVVQELPLILEAEPVPALPKEIFFVKTNLLLPLGNIGVEVPIGNQWSVGADFYYPWFRRNSNHKNCVQALMWNLEGRYWLGKDRKLEDLLEGHSVGLNVMVGYYDMEKNYKGYQGDFVNFSFDYTYSKPIFQDKLHLEFTIGLGYFYSLATKYEVFEEGGKGYKSGYKERFRYLGPNKLGVSLVVPIKSYGRKQK